MTRRQLVDARMRFGTPVFYLMLFGLIAAVSLLTAGCSGWSNWLRSSPSWNPEIRDLQALVSGREVALSWSAEDAPADVDRSFLYGFSVMKREIPWQDRNRADASQAPWQFMKHVSPQDRETTGEIGAGPARYAWSDPEVSPRRAYQYQVAIQDGRGETLAVSNRVLAKVVAPPPAPRNLTAKPAAGGIALSWRPPAKSGDWDGQATLLFGLERRTQAGSWEDLGTPPVPGTTFLDRTVASERTYQYRVRSVLEFEDTTIAGDGAVSAMVRAPAGMAMPPPKRVIARFRQGAVEIGWAQPEQESGGFHVYRREGSEIVRLTATPVAAPPFVDNLVTPGAAYGYAVSAVTPEPPHQEGLLSQWVEVHAVSAP